MKTRKELPPFLSLKRKININEVIKYLEANNYLEYSNYTDIKKSSESHYKNFLVGNSYSKNAFFLEKDGEKLEGELYKQLYITSYKYNQNYLNESDTSVKTRLRRIQKDKLIYVPELDEHNYGAPTKHYTGIIEKILSEFISPLTRVRLAVLMPGMTIKKHRDYDPSYICRYHIPIITNNAVEFGMEIDKKDIIFHMKNDGSIYFFNSGLPHWVSNKGESPRLHLIVDTNGQLDIDT
jgi:hypothetical protein